MSVATLPRTRNKDQVLAWANRQKNAPLSTAQAAAMDSVYPEWRKTINGVWFTNLEAVEAFVAAHGFFPRAGVKDPAEKAIGIWLATQRYRVNLLSADRIKLLEERLPGWNKSKEEAWNERLDEVCAIVAALGRLPKYTEKDPEAKKAQAWIRNHRAHPDTDWRVITLNERLPGWNFSTQDLWSATVDAVAAFVATHDRMPTQHEKSRVDKSLGTWLNGQRCERNLSAYRRGELDRRLPGWDRTAEDKWNDALDFVVAFYGTHDKLPNGKSADAAEAFHGRWIRTQNRDADAVLPHRQAILDERLPVWRNKRDERWTIMLEKVVAFLSDNGRMPSSNASEPDEAAAGRWVVQQRQGIRVTPAREEVLRARLPQCLAKRGDTWTEKLHETVRFFAEHGRMPGNSTKDQAERRLATWLQRNRSKPQSAERISALDTHLPQWRVSSEDVWNGRLEYVAAFWAANGRFPAHCAKDKQERKHAIWLSNQKITASKDPARAALLRERLPAWGRSYDDIWNDHLKNLIAFVGEHGRFPTGSKTGEPDEFEQAQWLNHQRRNEKLKAAREAVLDEKLPGWRG
jgi:uncharacterized protein CbrC (UPF0167 family)